MILMELVEIISSEKIDRKKIENEVEKGKYNEDMLALNSKKNVVKNG